MKIAQLAPLYERVPPKKYGGTERIVHFLTEGLVQRGHEVTLFASGDSITKSNLIPITPKPLRGANISDANIFTSLSIARAYKMSTKFDLIHNHTYPEYLAFPAAYWNKTPTLTTLHGPIALGLRDVYEEYKDLNFVSISNSQRQDCNELNWKSTIHHGIPVERFPFGERSKNYLLYVGRISPEKGTHIAIDIAKATGIDLIIAAKLDKVDTDYFNQYIAAELNHKRVRWVGEVDDQQRNKLMSQALCLLHTITWEEPFGLTMIEAMATGCPVIAFDKGSVPEIIVNKKTGFIVKERKEAIQAIQKIESISRKHCRDHVENNFNLKKMVDAYEKLYYEIINDQKITPTSSTSKKTKSRILV